MGVDREELDTPTCALNSMLIGMYKGNVLGFMRTHRFIHPDFFVRRRAFGHKKVVYIRPLVLTRY